VAEQIAAALESLEEVGTSYLQHELYVPDTPADARQDARFNDALAAALSVAARLVPARSRRFEELAEKAQEHSGQLGDAADRMEAHEEQDDGFGEGAGVRGVDFDVDALFSDF